MLHNRYDLEMQQGVTFQLQFNVQDANTNPINLTGYVATMQIRPTYSSNVVVESLSTANGEIVMGSNSGVYLFTLPATRTANIYVNTTTGVPPKSIYVYDISLTNLQATTVKIAYGQVTMYGEVTR